MKKPSNSNKRAGGPTSDAGKLVSSKNAIKAGLTTSQLLSEKELDRYDQIKKDLKNHYNNQNPLIDLQIERIARLQIQLERIQNAVDVLYRKSEILPSNKNQASAGDEILFNLKFKIMSKMIGVWDCSAWKQNYTKGSDDWDGHRN